MVAQKIWYVSVAKLERQGEKMKRKNFCILHIMLFCVFLTSCRAPQTKTAFEFEETVVDRTPDFWVYQSTPSEYWYHYGWLEPSSSDFIADKLLHEQRIEERIARLESTVEKLVIENQVLITKLEETNSWKDFWERLAQVFIRGYSEGLAQKALPEAENLSLEAVGDEAGG